MTAAQALRMAVQQLAAGGIEGGARDARVLLAYAMQIAPDRLTLHLPDALEPLAESEFDRVVQARLQHQPVAQIIGQRLFWGRPFKVTQDTLDPRPETEILVQAALQAKFTHVLDLGTGTGCVLLSLLADMPQAQGVGTDLSLAALEVAAFNAANLGLVDRATLQRADWFQGVTGRFDLIVSNPPYISASEMLDLSQDVMMWEPHLALSPGGDGLDPYRSISAGAGAFMVSGGRLMFEIGPTQADAVTTMLIDAGFQNISVMQDLDGRDRVVAAQKP
ncbi:MAG: peptide chain release factor N(5)-glutamine methyltransferase [Cypionkella sp.]